jgi:hypothetical protein
MWLNYYCARLIMEERVKDALHKAEQVRLVQAAKGPRGPRKWRWLGMLRVTLSPRNLLAIFTGRGVAEHGCRSPSAAPNSICKTCVGSRASV